MCDSMYLNSAYINFKYLFVFVIAIVEVVKVYMVLYFCWADFFFSLYLTLWYLTKMTIHRKKKIFIEKLMETKDGGKNMKWFSSRDDYILRFFYSSTYSSYSIFALDFSCCYCCCSAAFICAISFFIDEWIEKKAKAKREKLVNRMKNDVFFKCQLGLDINLIEKNSQYVLEHNLQCALYGNEKWFDEIDLCTRSVRKTSSYYECVVLFCRRRRRRCLSWTIILE